MSKYGDLIKEARNSEKADAKKETEKSRNQEIKNSVFLDLQNNIPTISEEKLAGISIKVPENLRRHWVTESKRKGKSMTSVIINALTEEFGKP